MAEKLTAFSRLFNTDGQSLIQQTQDALTDGTHQRTDAEVGAGH
jgi:hypothetical protein